MASGSGPALLCISNYPANTGYAWDFIESLYARMAEKLAPQGVRTLVAYPRIDSPPRTLEGTAAVPVELDATLRTFRSVLDTIRVIRREGVRVLYLTDRPAWSSRYALLRAGGTGFIVVHDHSSGEREVPAGLRRLAKWTAARAPLMTADAIVTVSDYVARRQIQAGLIPAERVQRVWNGIPVPPVAAQNSRRIHATLRISPDRPIVACACRTAPQKGVPHLLKAFDLLVKQWPAARPTPALVYMGDGPQFADVVRLHERLDSRDSIVLTGYRNDAGELIASADVCAMPSLWQDALPLAVAQPMALGRPVVASAVGGIPEMIVHGETGYLVPPGDEPALADALRRLLLDPALADRFGRAGRERIAQLFTPESQIEALTAVVRRGLPTLNGSGRRSG